MENGSTWSPKEIPKSEGQKKKKKKRKKVVSSLDKNQSRKHKIKPSSVPYRVHLKEAKPYLGTLDLAKAPPIVSAIEDQPLTSTAAPRPPPSDNSSGSEPEIICPPTSFHSSSNSSSPSSSSSFSSEGNRTSTLTNAMFFEDPRPSTDRQRWLCGFYNYLALPEAGHRKKQQRIQHASQMRLLLEAMAPEEDNLDCLEEDGGWRSICRSTPRLLVRWHPILPACSSSSPS